MTQDNIQTDTPQEGSNDQQYTSLEEAVFGGDNVTQEGSQNISDVFTTGNEGNTEQVPEQGQPQVSDNGSIQAETPQPEVVDNDTKRYQYWQSQSDKKDQRIKELEGRIGSQGNQPSQVAPQEAVSQPMEEFPAPPEKPQRPRAFSREEAFTDSSSESARFLDAKEDWDEQMVEYNGLYTQYQNALLQEKFDSMEQKRVEEAKRQQASQNASKQKSEILSYVTGHHGMDSNEANDFLTKMSDPASVNIDNLVQLYRLQGSGNTTQTSAPAPSQSFQQTKNAQQVPSSMGVMPSGQSNVDGRTIEDKMIDTMIGDFNSKNPWK